MSGALEDARRGTEIFLGLGTTLVLVTGGFVTARVTWGLRSFGKFNVDDYLSVAAVILLAATFAIFYKFLQAYIGGSASFFYTSQLIVAQAIVSGFATWFAKAPILVLYLRLFGIRTWVRVICWFMLVATAIAYLVAISYNAAGCTPKSRDVGAQFVIDCTHLSSVVGVSLGGIAVATDTIIFLIPMPIVLRLNLSLQKKIGLALVFFTGSLGTIASAVALSFKVQSLSGASTDVTTAVILTIVELSIAISVGCAPAARSFWADIVKGTVLYSSLASWASQVTFRLKSRGSPSATNNVLSDIELAKKRPTIHPYEAIYNSENSKGRGEHGSSVTPLVDVERRGQGDA